MKRIVAFAVLAGCTKTAPAPDASPAPRYGAVMVEVARRFELAGRAMNANRFELAAFEIGELGELFDQDLPRAALPKEGSPAALPGMASAFVKTNVPQLANAAKAKDGKAFGDAFERAAAACNACHQGSGHGFIQVPSAPGKTIPDLDPVPKP
jgi:hypothetical protein